MIYAFSLLISVLALTFFIPALKKIVLMRDVAQNGKVATGKIVSTKSAMNSAGWLFGMVGASEMVNHDRLLVSYQSDRGREISIEVIPSSRFRSKQGYASGQAVEVKYDSSNPWRAYLVNEWSAAHRDFLISAAGVVFGIALWIVGRYYNLPF